MPKPPKDEVLEQLQNLPQQEEVRKIVLQNKYSYHET